MKVRRFAPSSALAPFVRAFEVLETDGAIERTLIPETGLIIGFRYAGSATLLEGASRRELPWQVVTGLRSTARRMRTSPGGGMVVAKLREGAAAAFLDVPLHELFGEAVALRELVDRSEVDLAAHRIEVATGDRDRVAAIEQFLLARRERRSWRADPVVRSTLRSIHADPGALRVGTLARTLDVSVDGLEKRFRRAVGASPKQLASIVRMRRAIESHASAATLTQLALDAGYYDQAHFTRQLVASTGVAPRRFFTTVDYCV